MANKLGILTRRKLKQFLFDRGIVALDKNRYDNACLALSRAVTELIPQNRKDRNPGATGIVFSKDRPIQLFGLLKSYLEHAKNPPKLVILVKASLPETRRAYLEVETLLASHNFEFVADDGFRDSLLACLEEVETEKVFFLVDDIVFIRPVDFTEFLGFGSKIQVPSLRMAPHLSYCYTYAVHQSVPQLKEIGNTLDGEKMYSWKWSEGEYDWAYALSADGHCFNTDEILVMSRLVDFSAPNSYEVALQWFRDLYSEREGICYEKTRLINIPFNRVQIENKNIAGDVSAKDLLKCWFDGLEIDIKRYSNFINKSAHQEMELFLKPRD